MRCHSFCLEIPGSTCICQKLLNVQFEKLADHTLALDTIVPTSTITTFPSSRLYRNEYLADPDGPAIIPGIPTDLNGPSYAGAYDATFVEVASDSIYSDASTTL